jgi:hypothetical protein
VTRFKACGSIFRVHSVQILDIILWHYNPSIHSMPPNDHKYRMLFKTLQWLETYTDGTVVQKNSKTLCKVCNDFVASKGLPCVE